MYELQVDLRDTPCRSEGNLENGPTWLTFFSYPHTLSLAIQQLLPARFYLTYREINDEFWHDINGLFETDFSIPNCVC